MITIALQNIMENFYHCSHLPISAFNHEHQQLLTTGHTPETSKLLSNMLSNDLIIQLSNQLKQTPIISYHAGDEIHFSLCPINKEAFELGYFIIGPYTTHLELKERFLFKPAHCVTHLIDLLYAIGTPTSEKGVISTSSSNVENDSLDEYSYHVTKAKDYIEKHYAQPITLNDLANYLGINKSYFCTIFKKVTKHSFCTYTNMVRIEESKRLLISTTLSILDIALSVGFSSASYFNTTFKKQVGMTPIEYRHQNS